MKNNWILKKKSKETSKRWRKNHEKLFRKIGKIEMKSQIDVE